MYPKEAARAIQSASVLAKSDLVVKFPCQASSSTALTLIATASIARFSKYSLLVGVCPRLTEGELGIDGDLDFEFFANLFRAASSEMTDIIF